MDKFTLKAISQTDVIIKHFEDNSDTKFTPSDILKECFVDGTLLTSVRRSISNLTRDGKLEKLEEKITGPHGRPEYYWILTGIYSEQL